MPYDWVGKWCQTTEGWKPNSCWKLRQVTMKISHLFPICSRRFWEEFRSLMKYKIRLVYTYTCQDLIWCLKKTDLTIYKMKNDQFNRDGITGVMYKINCKTVMPSTLVKYLELLKRRINPFMHTVVLLQKVAAKELYSIYILSSFVLCNFY